MQTIYFHRTIKVIKGLILPILVEGIQKQIFHHAKILSQAIVSQ